MRNKTINSEKCKRSTRGAGLVDLLVATVIMTFVAAAIFSLLVGIGAVSQKCSNKIDSINSARSAIEKIGKDIRCGRSLGDVFGSQIVLQSATSSTAAVMGVQGSDTFPSTLDPVYGSGQSPPGGWPWAGPPYTLSGSTLVVQVPVFDNGGFPTAIPSGAGSPATSTVQDNVETHIYRVIPDPDQVNHAGEFILQISRVAGFAAPDYVPEDVRATPQTILTGIVGPFDSEGNINTFQYLDKTDSSGTAQDSVSDPSRVANYTGVIVNIEVLKHDESTRVPQALAVKSEVFLRNNALATTVGQPASLVN